MSNSRCQLDNSPEGLLSRISNHAISNITASGFAAANRQRYKKEKSLR